MIRSMLLTLLLATAVALVAGCAAVGAPVAGTGDPASPVATAPGSCHARGTGKLILPDAACTPGATNPHVTQATIARTICRSGWTATVRPPASYTNALKREQMAAYGDQGSPSGYVEDHLIPLELGGAPSDPRNLWPEPGASPNPKDRVENALNDKVCTGRIPLADAQREIATDWITAGRRLGVL